MVKFEVKKGELYIDGKKVLRAWESFTGWYWFGIEEDGPKRWFGYVQGLEDEWGYFDERELESLAPRVWEIRKADLPYSGRRALR
jgi:hypothetical protein